MSIMKKSILVVVGLLLGFSLNMQAHNVDQVHTKTQVVHEGFISEQVPGKYIVVNSICSTVSIKSSEMSELHITGVQTSELTGNIAEWVGLNLPTQQSVEVASFVWNGHNYVQTLVIEKGTWMKVVVFEDKEVKVEWKDVVKTTKTPGTFDQLTGVMDVVTLKNGKRYKGYVIEQIVGKELRIQTAAHEIHSCAFKEILSIRTEPIDSRTSLWKQIPLLDIVELKDGKMIEGFVTSRIMGLHLTVMTPNSENEQEIPLKQVAKYRKVLNLDYEAPLFPEPEVKEVPAVEEPAVAEDPVQTEPAVAEEPVEVAPVVAEEPAGEEVVAEEPAVVEQTTQATPVVVVVEITPEPAVVEEKAAPAVEEKTAPAVEEKAAPEVVEPAQITPVVEEPKEVAQPVENTPAPVEEVKVVPVVEEQPAPVPVMVEEQPAPVPVMVEEKPAPVVPVMIETPAPVVEEKPAPAPAEEEQEAPAPVYEPTEIKLVPVTEIKAEEPKEEKVAPKKEEPKKEVKKVIEEKKPVRAPRNKYDITINGKDAKLSEAVPVGDYYVMLDSESPNVVDERRVTIVLGSGVVVADSYRVVSTNTKTFITPLPNGEYIGHGFSPANGEIIPAVVVDAENGLVIIEIEVKVNSTYVLFPQIEEGWFLTFTISK